MSIHFLCLFLLCFPNLQAQDTLSLQNPSFEDSPRHSKTPEGWINCGFRNETPPDIGPTSFFRANTQASAGETHLIMVTRDNGTWERIGNLLSSPMQAHQCYSFSLDLARSPIYLSLSRVEGTAINFTGSIRLRIWSANHKGKLQELLGVSDIVNHEAWQRYTFNLCPSTSYPMLVLEAMYEANAPLPYGGNILLDNCSPLIANTTKRDETRLLALRAEAIPKFRRRIQLKEVSINKREPDTSQLIIHLQDIARGRIDIGLSDLAAYAATFTTTHWTLLLSCEENKTTTLSWKMPSDEGEARFLTVALAERHNSQPRGCKPYLRLLRQRIKAMGLRNHLRLSRRDN